MVLIAELSIVIWDQVEQKSEERLVEKKKQVGEEKVDQIPGNNIW